MWNYELGVIPVCNEDYQFLLNMQYFTWFFQVVSWRVDRVLFAFSGCVNFTPVSLVQVTWTSASRLSIPLLHYDPVTP